MFFLKNVIDILERNRTDIFIGIIGLLFAVIVFIAEQIANYKYEVEKKALLYKLELLPLFAESLFILFVSWFLELIENLYIKSSFIYALLYLLFEFLSIVLIICVTLKLYYTFKTVIGVIKNLDDKKSIIIEYLKFQYALFNKKLNDFRKIARLNREKVNRLSLDYSDYFKIDEFPSIKEYFKSIKVERDVYIKDVDINKLESIIKRYCVNINVSLDSSKNKNININNDKKKIIMSKFPGDSLKRGETLFYTNVDIDESYLLSVIKFDDDIVIYEKEYENNFKEIARLYKDSIYTNQEDFLKSIYNIFSLYEDNRIFEFISNEIFSDYENKFKISEKLSSSEVLIIQNRLDFLVDIFLDSKNDKLNISDYVTNICINTLELSENSMDFSFYFINHIFAILMYGCEINNDSLYSNLMGNLLSIFIYLFKNNKFDEAYIIADNLYIGDNSNKYNINFSFFMGIVKLYIVIYYRDCDEKDNFVNDNKEKIISIFDLIKKKLFFNMNCIPFDSILNTLNSNNKIRNTSGFIEFVLLRKKYSNSYSGYSVSEYEIAFYSMSCLVHHFDINTIINVKDSEFILKNFIINMLKFNVDKSILELLHLSETSTDYFKEYFLEPVFDRINREYHNYISNVDLTNEIELFKTMVRNLFNVDNLINYEFLNIKLVNKKSKKFLPYYNAFPKLFFKKYILHDNGIRLSLKKTFNNYLLKILKEKIDEYSNSSDLNLSDYLDQVDNLNDYVILTDRFHAPIIKKVLLDKECSIKIFDFLDFDYFSNEYIYLINKNNFPILELYTIDDSVDGIKKNNVINKYLYIDVGDLCNKDCKLSIDGNEIDNEEKREYVYVSIFIAFDIKIKKNSEIVLIKNGI